MREGQSLLEVRAAGINFADVLIKNGMYPQPPELPTVLGNEVAGDIGDRRVVAFVRSSGGGYAERVAVEDEWVFDLPAGASYAEGAAFLTTYLTAWIPMTRQARIHPDTNVLVTAAAGGVGTAAIQVAAFCGATVTAAAGSEEKRELARTARRPAHRHLRRDRRARRHRRRLRPGRRAGLRGVHQGAAPARRRDRDRLRRRHLGAGRPGAARRPQRRRPGLLPRPADGLPTRSSSGSRSHELLALWRRGALHPVVGAEFPLEQANEALDLIASRQSTGKVVLVP